MEKETRVLFIDAFSTLHVGNGALLDNSHKISREVFETSDISIVTSDPATNFARYKNVIEDVFSNYPPTTHQKLIWTLLYFLNCSLLLIYAKLGLPKSLWLLGSRFRRIAIAIDAADCIVSISGESINDHFAPQMYMRLYLFWICIFLEKKFFIFPQSIGPVFRSLSKKLLRRALANAEVVFARDHESFELSKDILSQLPVKVVYCPDVAITQDSPSSSSLRCFSQSKKVIGLTLSFAPKEICSGTGYVSQIIKSISATFDPSIYSLLLMPSNYQRNGISPDYKICLDARNEFREHGFDADILDNTAIHPDEFQEIQKSLYIFISSRMHVGILATSAGTPTIMLNTQHKIRGYMRNIGMERFVVEFDTISTDLPKLARECIDSNVNIRVELLEINKKLRESVLSTIKLYCKPNTPCTP